MARYGTIIGTGRYLPEIEAAQKSFHARFAPTFVEREFQRILGVLMQIARDELRLFRHQFDDR